MYLQDHPGLLECYTDCVNFFEAFCEDTIISGDINPNGLLLFYYYSVLFKTGKFYKEKGTIQHFIKS